MWQVVAGLPLGTPLLFDIGVFLVVLGSVVASPPSSMSRRSAMEPALAILVGILVAVAVWLMLSRNFVRLLLGFVLGNGVNLSIFVAGRLSREARRWSPRGRCSRPLPPTRCRRRWC